MKEDEERKPQYESELKQRLKQLQMKEDEIYEELKAHPSMKNIDRLNNIQMDIATVESRIKHLGEERGGIEQRQLPKL